ncbi:MAG: phosphoethanolamine--lipid A transferase [Pigmentiphaga sp.]|jgi:Predicted membrane-associated, metal-dependent hydrolase|uniref:phosphoethanolamine transferase n=1 Tax=Pigmentiphaga sp. TaxID=1977564 RepID=UPI0025DABD4F|nr:phosphoethanolamine--lipid A transferase [Pigmentiphaga sp.]MBX6317844.1 phosphoethanolamine--lipid A transferase [Pigmentiphaga sp.]MDX3904666.1 phosphoethanolamine--lipid A transferase [Pigmentiphaga sp.]
MSGLTSQGRIEADVRQEIAATPPKQWSVERLVLVVIGLLVVFANLPFWQIALAGRSFDDPKTWQFVFSTAMLIAWLHAVPALILSTRFTVRPVLTLFVLSALIAQHMMRQYGVVLDPSMLRNALRTDVREASELITPWFIANVCFASVAAVAIWRIPLRQHSWRRALGVRVLTVVGVSVVGIGALLLGFQDFSSTMRNQKGLRYRITPANVIYSTIRVLADDLRDAARTAEPLMPIRTASAAVGQKPRLLVLVVGETARAMNFSLNGYPRPTNPELSKRSIINFPQTSACGTSTEVSLPCMFSSQGRADYDEARIRASESLIQLLARAGMRVVWLDNQSGCKNVCAGVEFKDVSSSSIDSPLCPGNRCFDGVLVEGLREIIDVASKGPAQDTVVVLHQLGNHGPAYAKRYPQEFAQFKPECKKAELRDCSRDEIVNAYDNAILYTDHIVASIIDLLATQEARFDVGLIYVSDHGESLGEKGLYLHGMPYAIAPQEQLAVPMVWWFGGTGARGWDGIDEACLRRRASQPAHHDNLFHSVLGLFRIETERYVADRDLIGACRRQRSAP